MTRGRGVIWKGRADLDSVKDILHISSLVSATISEKGMDYGMNNFRCRFFYGKFALAGENINVYFHLINFFLGANLGYNRM